MSGPGTKSVEALPNFNAKGTGVEMDKFLFVHGTEYLDLRVICYIKDQIC